MSTYPNRAFFGDEGAANHTRLTDAHGKQGLELFVFGASSFNSALPKPSKFPARQTLEASQAICQLHQLKPSSPIITATKPCSN